MMIIKMNLEIEIPNEWIEKNRDAGFEEMLERICAAINAGDPAPLEQGVSWRVFGPWAGRHEPDQ